MRASDSFDEDALFCDFAQFYHVFDLRQMSLEQQAVLACGLPEESRTMRAMSGRLVSTNTLLLAGILDQLRISAYNRTKAAKKQQNRPKLIMPALLTTKKEEDEVVAFDSGEDFKRERDRLLKGIKNG